MYISGYPGFGDGAANEREDSEAEVHQDPASETFHPVAHRLGWGFVVQGLGFGVWGLGFGVWGLGFGVWGLGFGVWGLGFGV